MSSLRTWLRRVFRGIHRAEASLMPEDSAPLARLSQTLVAETEAMADHAFADGKEVPPALMGSLQTLVHDGSASSAADLGELSKVHQALARLVHPATPRAILLLEQEKDRPWFIRLLGPVPLIRGLVVAAVISVAAWIGLSLTEAADGTVNWTSDHGIRLLIEELHLLSAAGVGAAFASLFQASRFVTRGSFDPKYSSSYWVRFVLGIVAGMILALLISPQSEALGEMGAPLLAMLGGFSVSVVYRVLKRLVSTVEALVGGDLAAQAGAAIESEQIRVREEQGRERIKLGGVLLKIQNLLGGTDSKEDSTLLENLISNLLGTSTPPPSNPPDDVQEEEQVAEQAEDQD